jgi:hypothetical protein
MRRYPRREKELKMGTKFESKTCPRCGGSGKYGPLSVYAGICFKCHGAGYVLTKRGAAAAAYFKFLLSKRTVDLVAKDGETAGDMVRVDGFTAGSLSVPTKWVMIHKVEAKANGMYDLHGPEGIFYCNVTATTMHRVAHAKADKAPLLEKALAYEATLTKSGTLRKGKLAA